MDLLRNKFLLYPILFIAVLFVLDKIFLLPEVRDNFIQPGGMIYYRQREEQLATLRTFACREDRKERLVAVLGDSRSFALGQDMIPRDRRDEFAIFNFSGPQAMPVYHHYLAEKMLVGNCRPDVLLMGIAPDAMNHNSPVFVDPNLNFGVDRAFIERHRALIPDDVYASYENTRRFALAGLGLSVGEFFERLEGSLAAEQTDFGMEINLLEKTIGSDNEDSARRQLLEGILRSNLKNLTLYRFANSQHRLVLDATRGAQYAWFGVMEDAELRKETDRLRDFYLSRFLASPEQLYFYEQTLALARRSGVQVLVFWPRVNPHLIEAYRGEPRIGTLWSEMDRIARLHGAKTIDLNGDERAACSEYYDASHLSISCFPVITEFLLNQL